MGVSRLEDLPELPDITVGDGVKKLEDAIDKLQNAAPGQLSIEDMQ